MVKRIKPVIDLITSSNVDVKLNIDFKYDLVLLVMVEDNEQVEMDRLLPFSNEGNQKIILKKKDTEWSISANFINITYLFYKDFRFEFFSNGELVAKTDNFKIEPKGKKNLYGIVNKLLFDFNKLWSVSGTTCTLFKENPTAQKCSYCWDFDLNQRISTDCPYCENGVVNEFISFDFKARNIKTQTSQITTPKGIEIINLTLYTTFSRFSFVLGDIFFDNTTRDFYEIKNAVPASVGGVRTSTSLTAQRIDINDDRVKKLIPYLK